MAVLGSKHTRDRFVFISNEKEWLECGAFCVKFFNQGKEDIVIVDDAFPFVGG
jgi:hypothetical protein